MGAPGASLLGTWQSPPWSLAADEGTATATFTPSTDDGTVTHGLPVWTKVVEPTAPKKSTAVSADGDSESIQIDDDKENQQ
jgi:hypothetical protein